MDSDEDFLSNLSSDVEVNDGSDIDIDVDYEDDEHPIETPSRKVWEVDFKVLSPADIQAQQDEMINNVNSVIMLGTENVATLLRHFHWHKDRLFDAYMEDPEATKEAAGLSSGSVQTPRLEKLSQFFCEICCDDEPGIDTFAMSCGHRYCARCYSNYVTLKIKEEGESSRIRCPASGCNRIVDKRDLELLVTSDVLERYLELLTRSYVEDRYDLKWCPAPDCMNAVECATKRKDLLRLVPTVKCSCKHRFCFGCSMVDHQPAPCSIVKLWVKKCADDSETANWINAHTKECPNCASTIEKNGGCNHMTCRKCRHEFCWMCMGLWSEHGTSWYSCNRFQEKSGSDARDAQAQSRKSLERYLHYYNRYNNHEQSARLDKDIFSRTEQRMVQLQTSSGMSWIEVQYLQAASECLQTCRQTLKWTYAFAYYLARNNSTEIFEDNQKDLEMAVEALSAMFEKPIAELAESQLKVDILDKTSYCNRRRVILLNDTANGLEEGRWEFQVSLNP